MYEMKTDRVETGVLFEPDTHHKLNDCWTLCDCYGGGRQPLLPRSYVSDGHRSFLLLHVLLQLAAFVFTLAGGLGLRSTHSFPVMDWIVALTSSSHAFAIIILLGTAAWANFPTEQVLLTAVNFFLFLVTGALTCAEFALTVSTDPEVMDKVEHRLLFNGIFLQAAAFSCFLACVVGLAANGGQIARVQTYADDQGDQPGRVSQLKSIRRYR